MIKKGVNLSLLLQEGVDFWTRSKNERLKKERIWYQLWLAYDSKFGETWDEIDDFRSKRYLPVPWKAVETVSSRIVQSVMPTEDWFDCVGRTPNDDTGAKMMKSLLNWQHYKASFRVEFAKLIKHACIFGNVPYCIHWETVEQQVPDRGAFEMRLMMQAMGQEDQGNGEIPMKKVRKYDGPALTVGNIFDYVQDLTPNSHKTALRCMRSFKSHAYLMAMSEENEDGYSVYDRKAVKNLSDQNTTKESSDSLKRALEREIGINRFPEDKVELLQLEGDIEVDGKLYQNHILVIGNRLEVLRFEPNPFLHGKPTWNMFVLHPEPNETYGRGILEPNMGLNDIIQVRVNQVIDANTLSVNPIFKFKRDGVFDPENFVSAAGALIECADPNNIQPLVTPNTTVSSMQELGFILQQFNSNTGASDNFSQPGQPVSATEASITASMANSSMAETIKHVEHTAVIPMLEMEMSLNQQLMDRETWIRIISDGEGQAADPKTGVPYQMGPAPFKVTPEDIAGEYDIFPVGSSAIVQNQQKVGQVIQMTTAFLQSPLAEDINGQRFLNEAYKMIGYNRAWVFLKTPEEKLAEQQQKLAQLASEQQITSAQQPGGQGGMGKPGPEPGPRGSASLAGVAEGGEPGTTRPSDAQLAANRLM